MKGEIGHGNYIPTPVASGPGTTVVPAGTVLERLYRPGTDGEVPPHFVVEADAVLRIGILVLPGTGIDLPLTVDLVGEGAEVKVSAVYVCGGDERVRFRVLMHHRAAHTTSRQLFNGIAGGQAVTDFSGTIVVAPDAQQIEAYQENHNILLTDTARVQTQPRLEIYADDVKCSHGATIGRLNEEEQFYMRSRGIPEEEARVLQMISFVSPVLAEIPESLRPSVAAELESAVRSL